jgi:hypothetical protein
MHFCNIYDYNDNITFVFFIIMESSSTTSVASTPTTSPPTYGYADGRYWIYENGVLRWY